MVMLHLILNRPLERRSTCSGRHCPLGFLSRSIIISVFFKFFLVHFLATQTLSAGHHKGGRMHHKSTDGFIHANALEKINAHLMQSM